MVKGTQGFLCLDRWVSYVLGDNTLSSTVAASHLRSGFDLAVDLVPWKGPPDFLISTEGKRGASQARAEGGAQVT